MSTKKLPFITLLLFILIHNSASAENATCENRSGKLRAQLIELYTLRIKNVIVRPDTIIMRKV